MSIVHSTVSKVSLFQAWNMRVSGWVRIIISDGQWQHLPTLLGASIDATLWNMAFSDQNAVLF